MNVLYRTLKVSIVSLVATLMLVGCATWEFREVQDDFNAAVAADNENPFTPLGPVVTLDLYEKVLERLNEQFIEDLEPKLRPTAYMMRAAAAWRTGEFNKALEAAMRGLALPEAKKNKRDYIFLQMIPGLVILEEIQRDFRDAGPKFSLADYNEKPEGKRNYPERFRNAYNKLRGVRGLEDPTVPPAVLDYSKWQQIRLLQEWRAVIVGIKEVREDRPPFPRSNELKVQAAVLIGLVGPEETLKKGLRDTMCGKLGELSANEALYNAAVQVLFRGKKNPCK